MVWVCLFWLPLEEEQGRWLCCSLQKLWVCWAGATSEQSSLIPRLQSCWQQLLWSQCNFGQPFFFSGESDGTALLGSFLAACAGNKLSCSLLWWSWSWERLPLLPSPSGKEREWYVEQLEGMSPCCFGVCQPASPSPPVCWHSSAWGRSPSPDTIALGASGLQGTGRVWWEQRTSSRQTARQPKGLSSLSRKLPWTVFAPSASPQDQTEWVEHQQTPELPQGLPRALSESLD